MWEHRFFIFCKDKTNLHSKKEPLIEEKQQDSIIFAKLNAKIGGEDVVLKVQLAKHITMLKNLIFDWGGVLSVSQHDEAVKRFSDLGLPNAETYFVEGQNWGGIFGQVESGEISITDFLQKVSELCGKTISFEEVAYAWWGFFHHLSPGILQQLEVWRKEGYRLFILTNNNPFMMSYINGDQFAPEGRPFRTYFDKIYVSCEIGLAKPAKAIYEYVLKDGHMKAEETVFADDRKQNLTGAAEAGMETYLVEDADNWINAFKTKL